MSVNLYNATVNDGLFNILGAVFMAQADLNTARGSTIPQDLNRLLAYFNTIAPNQTLEPTLAGVTTSVPSYQSSGSSLQSTLQQFAQNFTIALVGLDKTQPDSSLATALKYLIAQMTATAQTLNRSTVTATVSATAGNSGNGVILLSTKRGDGLVQENSLSESIAVKALSASLTAGLQFTGQAQASSPVGQDWPLGSACSAILTAIDANVSSLVTNGGMETQANLANVPDNWTLSVGTPGTHCLMTVNAVQNVVIAGSPASGSYQLVCTLPSGYSQTTGQIAWNATASSVQSAINALPGFSKVTVVDTGTTPNFTHAVTFTGVGGAVPIMGYQSFLNAGTITISPVTAGTPQVFSGGAAVQFKSDGATLTTLSQAMTGLSPSAAYAISLWACCDTVPTAGVVTVDLVNGIGGAVLQDAQGTNCSITFNANALHSNLFAHLSSLQTAECYFRTPATLPPLVYLRVRISTAVTSGASVFIDNVGLTAAQQLYPGGPYGAAFGGNVAFSTADTWTVTVANNRAGILREWLNRNMGMDQLGLLFPTSASSTIPDSVLTPYAGQMNFVLAANSEYLPLL